MLLYVFVFSRPFNTNKTQEKTPFQQEASESKTSPGVKMCIESLPIFFFKQMSNNPQFVPYSSTNLLHSPLLPPNKKYQIKRHFFHSKTLPPPPLFGCRRGPSSPLHLHLPSQLLLFASPQLPLHMATNRIVQPTNTMMISFASEKGRTNEVDEQLRNFTETAK